MVGLAANHYQCHGVCDLIPKTLARQGRKHLRANKNAERLHGGRPQALSQMNSPRWHSVFHTMPFKTIFRTVKDHVVPHVKKVYDYGKQKFKKVKRVVEQVKPIPGLVREIFTSAPSRPGGHREPGFTTKQRSPPALPSRPMRGTFSNMKGRLSSDSKTQRFRGHELVATLATPSGGKVAGDVLLRIELNPRMIGLSRLAHLSMMYEKFKFANIMLIYEPSCPATTAGSLIMYPDYDVSDTPYEGGIAALKRATNHLGSRVNQVWQEGTCQLSDTDGVHLWVDGDTYEKRLTTQGQFFVFANSTLAGSLALGNVYVQYDIVFSIPQLEVSAPAGHGGSWENGGTGVTCQWPFGTDPQPALFNDLDAVMSSAMYNPVRLHPGSYSIYCDFKGTVCADDAISPFADTGVPAPTTLFYSSSTNAAATQKTAVMTVYSADPFFVQFGSNTGTITECQATIAQMPAVVTALSQKKTAELKSAMETVSRLGKLLDPVSLIKENKEEKAIIALPKASSVVDTAPQFVMVEAPRPGECKASTPVRLTRR